MKKLLYVDDYEPNRMIVEFTSKSEFEILVVEKPSECIDLASENFYDIILIDLNLNDSTIDGFGVLHELKKMKHLNNSIFIAHTNFIGDDWEDRCISEGFHAYYPKPFKIESFKNLIQNI